MDDPSYLALRPSGRSCIRRHRPRPPRAKLTRAPPPRSRPHTRDRDRRETSPTHPTSAEAARSGRPPGRAPPPGRKGSRATPRRPNPPRSTHPPGGLTRRERGRPPGRPRNRDTRLGPVTGASSASVKARVVACAPWVTGLRSGPPHRKDHSSRIAPTDSRAVLAEARARSGSIRSWRVRIANDLAASLSSSSR
jgi:hypothetical protein